MRYPVAGFLRRFYALSVDCLILEIVGGLISFPLVRKYDLQIDTVIELITKGDTDNLQQIAVFLCINLLVLTLLWGVYFVYFIGSVGQTPGKKLLGIQVVRADDEDRAVGYKTALNRFVGLSLSASVLFLGFIWALFNDKRQTWHDKMAHTVVVRITSS